MSFSIDQSLSPLYIVNIYDELPRRDVQRYGQGDDVGAGPDAPAGWISQPPLDQSM
jgi:hypothetical protein